jgi:hypothetical protein
VDGGIGDSRVTLGFGQEKSPSPRGEAGSGLRVSGPNYQTDLLQTDLLKKVARAMMRARFEIMTYFISDLRIE